MSNDTSSWYQICAVKFAECRGKNSALSVLHPEIAEFFRPFINEHIEFINAALHIRYTEKIYVDVIETLSFLQALIENSFRIRPDQIRSYIEKLSKEIKIAKNK